MSAKLKRNNYVSPKQMWEKSQASFRTTTTAHHHLRSKEDKNYYHIATSKSQSLENRLRHLVDRSNERVDDLLYRHNYDTDIESLNSFYKQRVDKILVCLTEEIPRILTTFILLAEMQKKQVDLDFQRRQDDFYANRRHPLESTCAYLARSLNLKSNVMLDKFKTASLSIQHLFSSILESKESFFIKLVEKATLQAFNEVNTVPFLHSFANSKELLKYLSFGNMTTIRAEGLTGISVSLGQRLERAMQDKRHSSLKDQNSTPFESGFLIFASLLYRCALKIAQERAAYRRVQPLNVQDLNYFLAYGAWYASQKLYILEIFDNIKDKNTNLRIFPSLEQYLFAQARILNEELSLEICPRCGQFHLNFHPHLEGSARQRHLGLSFDCINCVLKGQLNYKCQAIRRTLNEDLQEEKTDLNLLTPTPKKPLGGNQENLGAIEDLSSIKQNPELQNLKGHKRSNYPHFSSLDLELGLVC